MSITGAVDSKIVSSYEADVSQHKAQVEMLRAQQQHFAAEVVKGLESQNKKLEDSISKWSKITVGIGTVVAAWKGAQVALEEYGKAQDLAAATQGVNLEGLRRAARGLRTDMDLLTFAAKTNAGAHKLTQEQMELAVKAMEVYEDRGHETAEVVNAVTDALIKGKAKGLQAFGVAVDDTGGKAEAFNNIIKALKHDVDEAGTQADVGADAWKRHGVSFQNAMSQIKQSLGEVVVAMTPLVGMVADMTTGIADFVKWSERTFTAGSAYKAAESNRQMIDWMTDSKYSADYAGSAFHDLGLEDPARRGVVGIAYEAPNPDALVRRLKKAIRGVNAALPRRKGAGGRGGAGGDVDALADAMQADEELIGLLVNGNAAFAPSVARFAGRPSSLGFGGAPTGGGAGGPSVEEQYRAFQAGKTQSRLEQVMGPIEDFDRYALAWQTLEGATAAAMDAWITGSMGAGKAIKMFFAESLRGMAIDMGVRALREGAMAIADLAIGNLPGAAVHGKAAAVFTVGAAAAAAGARQLGAGGGTATASAAPTGPPGGGTAASSAAPARPVIIAYGDDFADDSPRARAQTARRLVARGLGAVEGGEFR